MSFLGDGRLRAHLGNEAGDAAVGVRALYVRTEGRAAISRAERRAQESAGAAPRRVLVEEAFGFDLLGESDIRALPGLRGTFLRRLPMFIALALEASRRAKDYDVILTWAEKYTVGVAWTLCLRRRRPRHVAILDWVSKPIVRVPLRIVRSGVDDVLTWSSVQARVAVDRVGFAPEQVHRIEHPVDEQFFAPQESMVDPRQRPVVSAGETQRDFPTLMAAVAALGVPTIVAANLLGTFDGVRTRLVDARDALVAADGIQVGPLEPPALREAYASAFVVVVPLVESENNAGISVILEAMAMGRAVITSRTEGQVDVIRHGETGLYVTPGDVQELRAAIERLRDDPEEAARMGRRGRDEVLRLHRTPDFVHAVRTHVLAASAQQVRR